MKPAPVVTATNELNLNFASCPYNANLLFTFFKLIGSVDCDVEKYLDTLTTKGDLIFVTLEQFWSESFNIRLEILFIFCNLQPVEFDFNKINALVISKVFLAPE